MFLPSGIALESILWSRYFVLLIPTDANLIILFSSAGGMISRLCSNRMEPPIPLHRMT